MARGGINKALVDQARQALLARGEHPSIDALRIALGNTGSKTTIHRYLKELEASDAQDAPAALGEHLGALVAQLAEQLQTEARATVEQARAQWILERASLQVRLEQLEGQLAAQLQQASALEEQRDQARSDAQQTAQQVQRDAVEMARLSQARLELQARLGDREAQVQSLEDKHQHAREALEHYRRASQTQREQEQRQHESQVQHLQMEVRQLQQNTIVQQDLITQLNRGNERLLTEARLQQVEQLRLQECLEQQQTLHHLTQEQRSQEQALQATLQERLEQTQRDRTTLEQRHLAQQRREQQLERQLAEARTALKLLRSARSTPPAQLSAGDTEPGSL
ncbi:MAG: DNA-binding protein [Pseudomonas sp.]|uniref:DNA-binding protein n=1 Tax=Pseudomonas sp. TaxID=306 RepID=UPI003391C68F